MSNQSLIEKIFGEFSLEDIAYDFVRANRTGAVLAVRRGSQEQQIAAVGFADIDDEIPIKPTDSFRIASITKPFTAVLLLQLQELDYLSLDDPARTYLPDDLVEEIENVDEATIRHLLNMTSGIYDYLINRRYKRACKKDPTKQWSALEVMEYAKGKISDFDEVGKRWAYSNSNYVLLQIIVERLLQKSLGRLFEEHIFKPLGMTNTYLEHDKAGPLVNGYGMTLGIHRDMTTSNFATGLADCGLVSTANDLDVFMRGVQEGQIISNQSLRDMLQPTNERGKGSEYGLGVELIDTEFGTGWGHTGAVPGFTSMMWMFPEQDASVVVLRNVYDRRGGIMSVIDALDTVVDDDE